MRPIRVAVLGAGIGREHLRGYRALPERFEVATLCDLDETRARETLECVAPGAPIDVVRDVDAVLADGSIDLIDVCLPPRLHASVAGAALEAGRHVVCEKPLVTSPAEADALLARARASERSLFPVFQYRYGAAMARLSALVDAGLAGRPFVASLETHWNRGEDYYRVPWRGTWAGENGGAVLGHAIHNHDLLTTVLGPVESVSAYLATRVNEIEVEDCAAIALKLRSGALATSSITLGAASDTTRLRFCFERLTAESGSAPYAPADDRWTFTARDPSEQGRVDAVLAAVEPVRAGFAGFFEAVADALDGKPSRAVGAEDGRASIELVAAVYLAARSGRTVTLPLAPDAASYGGWAPVAR